MVENVSRHVIVRGRVQGVGYRAFVAHEADRRALEGWVRNRRDGTVEAVFAGPDDAVRAMIGTCRKGPPGSHVEAIEERAELAAGRGFLGGPYVWGLLVLITVIVLLMIFR